MYEYDGKPPKLFRVADSFTRRDGKKVYVFERPLANDSRVDQVQCTAEWFWGRVA